MNVNVKRSTESPLKAVKRMFSTDIEAIRSKNKRGDLMLSRFFLVWAYDRMGFSYEEIAIFINRPHKRVGIYLSNLRNRVKHDSIARNYFKEFQSSIKIF